MHIYRTFSQYFWKEIQIISPPSLPPLDGRTARTVLNSQLNFGIAVDIDASTDVIVVGANAYCKQNLPISTDLFHIFFLLCVGIFQFTIQE